MLMHALKVPPPKFEPANYADLTPVTLVTGFLGSGKTTIIQNLLKQLDPTQTKVVYIKNEAGDMDIDTKLVSGSQIVAQEILNGCVCCTLTGPLLSAIDELIQTQHPDRIIIETSGNAQPANLAVTLAGAPNIYRDGVICVIDALNYKHLPAYPDTYQIQAKLTDLLVLNKIDQISPERKQATIEQLRYLNSYSPIVEAPQAHLDAEIAFGCSLQTLNQLLEAQPNSHNHPHVQLDSISFHTDKPLDKAAFENFCHQLPEEVIRFKGFVYSDQMYVVNQVYKRIDIFKYPSTSSSRQTRCYALGFNLAPYREKLQQAFAHIKPYS